MCLRIVVLFHLCCSRFLVNAQDTKNVTSDVEVLNATIFVAGNFSTVENSTENIADVDNKTERITQPIVQPIIQPITQHLHEGLERSVPIGGIRVGLNNEGVKMDNKKTNFFDFKPSPLLETSYDFPILPGYAEPKFAYKHGDLAERKPWVENPLDKPLQKAISTEPIWNHKVVFPTNKPTPPNQPSYDRPYQFDKPNHQIENYQLYPPNYQNSIDEDIGLQPPARDSPDERDSYQPQTFVSVDKFEGHEVNDFKSYPQFELQEKPHSLDSIFPWKKIVKLLTTFVPIGILISALIPNVINISPINNTHNGRARFDENESRTKMQLIYSTKTNSELNRKICEQRILCELLLNAGYTRNGEENIEHLLESYVEQEAEIVEKTEELKNIMAAVNTGSCEKEFHCKAFRDYNNSN